LLTASVPFLLLPREAPMRQATVRNRARLPPAARSRPAPTTPSARAAAQSAAHAPRRGCHARGRRTQLPPRARSPPALSVARRPRRPRAGRSRLPHAQARGVKHAASSPRTVGKQKYLNGTTGTSGNDAIVGSNLFADNLGQMVNTHQARSAMMGLNDG